ncbi:MAG: DNA polymerase IV [Armatimonadetes bacterium]|nr:DNA polymerase IV [Armatimonadota bacterium]
MRSIIHFRLNSFFAALEQIRRPEFAGKPLLVTRKSGRGEFVVSASVECDLPLLGQESSSCPNNELTARHALRYNPTAVVIPADWDHYREASGAVMDILAKYSPLLEPHSLDRAYMDVTGCTKLFGSPKTIAREVQRTVLDQIGVPVSVGLARNKLSACAASSACNPGGYTAVRPGTEAEFMSQLPVGVLSGVGPKIVRRLEGLGVRTVGDLAAIPERLLIRQFGALGSRLRTQSQGIDHSPVAALYPPSAIIIEHTFSYGDGEPSEPAVVEAYMLRMCERLAMQMRKRGRRAGSLKLSLEHEGSTPVNRFYAFKSPVSSAHGIYIGARRILMEVLSNTSDASCLSACHGLRLTLSDLESGGGIQLSFMGDTERRMRLDAVLETIRSRFGDRAIACGAA